MIGAGPLDDAELTRRVGLLSLEQKVRLLTGADFWALYAEPEAGLRRLVTSDGPAGVRGESWDERDASANIPSATALAATWDTGRVAAIDERDVHVRVIDERVGERHAHRSCADDEIVGFERSHHADGHGATAPRSRQGIAKLDASLQAMRAGR